MCRSSHDGTRQPVGGLCTAGQGHGERRTVRALSGRRCPFLAASLLVFSGCVQEMANQPRVETLEPSAFFADGQGARLPIPETVPWRGSVAGAAERGDRRDVVDSAVTGAAVSDADRPPVTRALLERGRERFEIYCAHCHGLAGYGDGMVVQRGFPRPPSYHIDRLRDAPDEHLFAVITSGLGRMPDFGRRIEPADRRAIVAYVRALQLSQHAPLDQLPESDRARLPPRDPSTPLQPDSTP